MNHTQDTYVNTRTVSPKLLLFSSSMMENGASKTNSRTAFPVVAIVIVIAVLMVAVTSNDSILVGLRRYNGNDDSKNVDNTDKKINHVMGNDENASSLQFGSSSSLFDEQQQQHHRHLDDAIVKDINDGNYCVDLRQEFLTTRRPLVSALDAIVSTGGALAQSYLIRAEMTTRRFIPFVSTPTYWSDLWSMAYLFDDSFTNWASDTSVMGAIGKVITVREIMDISTVFDPYTPDEVAVQDDAIVCSDATRMARTADGTCNNLESPSMGAANTRFGRNTKPEPVDEEMLLTPNPRVVGSLYRVRDGEERTLAPILNMLSVGWIQFMIHDWNQHTTDVSLDNAVQIPLPDDDVLRSSHGLDTISVLRTLPDESNTDSSSSDDKAKFFNNENTHWWDGSQIYGSNQETQNRLRSMVDGKLIVETDANGKPRLPVASDGKSSDAGFATNWWLGLEVMHTIFVLEHNAICDMLLQNHSDWDDQRLFDVARLVTTHLIARIHSREWTLAILPNAYIEFSLASLWDGISEYMTSEWVGSVAGLLGSNKLNGVLNGIAGTDTDLAGHPYALTEEFVAVYRLHTLLPDELRFVNETGANITIPTGDTAKVGQSRSFAEQMGMGNVVRGMGQQMATATALHNSPGFLSDMETPHGIVDMPTTDVYRDRERGVPRYQEFRRRVGLKPVASFEDLTGGDTALAQEIADVYNDDLELVDLQIGMHAEGIRPMCIGFGETALQIFLLMAGFRLQKDRFFREAFNPEVYTQEGMDWVQQTKFRDILLRHFPELESDLADTENAFAPWA